MGGRMYLSPRDTTTNRPATEIDPMAYEFITQRVEDGVAFLTLQRPDVLNSFNGAMARELQRALAEAARDDAKRAVLLTGAGRAFCAGQDLAEAAPKDSE